MQVNNSGFAVNSQSQMPEPAQGERWSGFEGYATDILRSMREAGFSEEEIAMRRLHREMGSRMDNDLAKRNLLHMRNNRTGERGSSMANLGAPLPEFLSHQERTLNELLASAQNGGDELHRNHWIRALENMLVDIRNMQSGSSFSSSI